MKKQILHNFFALFLFTSAILFAQTEEHPWQFSFGFNAVDTFPTDAIGQGNLFEEFFNIGDHWNIAPYPSQIGIANYLGSGFSLGFIFSLNTISKYGNLTAENDSFFATDANIKYNLNTLFKTNRFAPFLESGGGYVFFDDVSAGYFNLGSGVEYVLGEKKKTVLFAKSLFRNTRENYGNKHFQHSIGLGFRFGAEKDRDEDGIFDKDDTCPDTPGLAEFNGCPDTDEDGIQDAEDACPDEAGLAVFNGCPDTDADGIEDREDACPDEAGLESLNGCPDSDGDGIQDAEDSCPEEAGLAAFNGCPDSDNDGVQDSLDECPDIVGTPANSGCPEISETIIEQLNEIGQSIYFPTNSSELNDNTKRIVDQVYDIIIAYPNYRIEVQGHTDNIGRDDANMRLSETRAISVSNYLISKGIPESRIYAKGYGETSPAESNVTARGRALNRRVEFNLISD
jgi:outer membrane protein OmpA-like peptidoglycan-associated protein